MQRAERICHAAMQRAESYMLKAESKGFDYGRRVARRALNRIEEIEFCPGYSEPGYSGDLIAFGNWNPLRFNSRRQAYAYPTAIERLPEHVGNLLETAGVSLEWYDEWSTCCDCGRAVRVSGDSYSWTPSYADFDGERLCHECIEDDPTGHLESLEGNARSADTIGIDLDKHDYCRVEVDFENGLYGGQAADPKLIAEALESKGISRYLFQIDSVGQFDMAFSCWVHVDEYREGLLDGTQDTDGPDPATMMKQALKNVPPAPGTNADGIAYTKVDISNGTAETYRVSREDFVKGKLP